jgi:signal transduction histidine kinase
MGDALRVLLVENSDEYAALVGAELRRAARPVTIDRVHDADSMRSALQAGVFDVIVSDWTLPTFGALAALRILHESKQDIPFIIMSGTIGEESAVGALRGGAHDFVLKDRPARLRPAIEREIREAQGRAARRRAEETLQKTEEQLRQAQKLEAIGSLAGGVAHDFNNMLSVILSYANLALEELAPAGALREDILEIKRAGERAGELTRQLLAFSRQQVLEPHVIDLNRVVGGMDKMLRRLLGEHVELAAFPAHRVGKVLADKSQIEQVLMNLVVNARDAMPLGGKLTIETANVILDQAYCAAHVGANPGPHVLLSVTDTGTGMDHETQERIFEPFFTTKGPGQGTGLGLSTVFGIVKQSGGHVWVHSELGHGTTFKVYLPRVEGHEEPASDPPGPLQVRGSETILLVEDEDQVRGLMRTVLRRHGYDVLEAQNGGEAFLICEQYRSRIDLLLTDLVLPRMNGRQVAERLMGMRPGVKVLFVSGHTDTSLLPPGTVAPDTAFAFLQKPITPEALLRKVREILDIHPTGPGSAPASGPASAPPDS